MNFFLLKYGAFIVICTSLAVGLFLHTASLNTKGITVSEDYSSLKCSEEINMHNADSSYEILRSGKTWIKGFDSYICTINRAYNGTNKDRAVLYSFSDIDLELWTTNRPDIAQYFYRKIVSSNPDDALSLYIKAEKLSGHNTP